MSLGAPILVRLRSLDPWLRSQVLLRSCGIGPVGTFSASIRWSGIYLRRDMRLSVICLVSLIAVIPAFNFVLSYPSNLTALKILWATLAVAILSCAIWLERWSNWTTSDEIAALIPVLDGTDQEEGYARCVVTLGRIANADLLTACLDHLNHALDSTRRQPEKRIWPLIDEELLNLVEGASNFETFEQKIGQVRSMFRAGRSD